MRGIAMAHVTAAAMFCGGCASVSPGLAFEIGGAHYTLGLVRTDVPTPQDPSGAFLRHRAFGAVVSKTGIELAFSLGYSDVTTTIVGPNSCVAIGYPPETQSKPRSDSK